MADFFLKSQKARSLLKRDLETGGVHQSYIFEGVEGIGKKTLAREFAKAILCQGENKPCGVCHSCAMFEASTHPEYIRVADNPVKIEKIRELNAQIYIKPLIAKRKVLIIENADSMNQPSQNAFLKTFEEPPGYMVIILLVSNAGNLLPTILSRGTRVRLSPFTEDETVKFDMARYGSDEKRAHFLARYSGGVIGRVTDIEESGDFFEKRGRLMDSVAAMTHEKITILPVIEAFGAKSAKTPDDVDVFFDAFTGFFRDISAIKYHSPVINFDYEEVLRKFSSRITAAAARNIVFLAQETRNRLNSSMKYDLWITDMMIKCWEEIYGAGNRG